MKIRTAIPPVDCSNQPSLVPGAHRLSGCRRCPFFLPDGDLIFRAIEDGSNYLYRMKSDGTGRRKITSERILDIASVSPDGRWIVAASPNSDEEHLASWKAFSCGWGRIGAVVRRQILRTQLGYDWKICLPFLPAIWFRQLCAAGDA